MMKNGWLAAGLACFAVFAFAAPKGTVARSAAIKYPAHAEQDGIAMGAVLLTGAGVVPPDSFTLNADDAVRITISGVGTLENPVAVV